MMYASEILSAIWAMFTNDGMYSTGETIIILVLAVVGTFVFEHYHYKRWREEQRANVIRDLGYDGYLRHKETMKSIGIEVDY